MNDRKMFLMETGIRIEQPFVGAILEPCPSPKVKINGVEYEYEETVEVLISKEFRYISLLRLAGSIGMVLGVILLYVGILTFFVMFNVNPTTITLNIFIAAYSIYGIFRIALYNMDEVYWWNCKYERRLKKDEKARKNTSRYRR